MQYYYAILDFWNIKDSKLQFNRSIHLNTKLDAPNWTHQDRVEYNSGCKQASNFEIGRAHSEHKYDYTASTSLITPWIVRRKVQLPINRINKKSRG